MPTQNQYTQSQLKQAYQIVSDDLFNRLVKAKNQEPVRFGSLGSFKKTENKITSYLHDDQGQRYAYYRLLFKPFSHLKQELNRALNKKYNKR